MAMMVAHPQKQPGGVSSSALVEYTGTESREEEEDYEVKIRRISDNVADKVSNTCSSSAGAGSGDFHQYCKMRRKEQDRLARMEADGKKKNEVIEFEIRKRQRLEATEAITAKKRAKRQKKKLRKKEKRSNNPNVAREDDQKEEDCSDGSEAF